MNHNDHFCSLYAHRGSSLEKTENTLAAFQNAIETGSPGVELDIQWLSDGTPVVYHDENITRFFHSPENSNILAMMTWQDVQKLESLPAQAGRHPGIPLLKDVFGLLRDRAFIDIEIKYYRQPSAVQMNDLMRLVQASGIAENIVISSFDPRILLEWKNTGSPVPCGLIYDAESKELVKKQSCWADVLALADFEKPHYLLNDDIKTALERERIVIAWTVDNEETGMELIGQGVRGIITNAPGNYRRLLTRSSPISRPS